MPILRTILAILALSLTSLPAQASDRLTVLLDWFVNPDHAPLVVGLEAGIFREAGLDVELIAPADPNDPPKLVAAGKAPLAVSYQPQLHIQASQGLPLTRIATLVATPLNSLVVLDSGPISNIADLKGRKIGYSVGGFEDALLGAMLQREGLGLDDVELINVNFSLSPSILTGQVDAVIGAFRNFELNQMDIVGHPGRAFFPEEHGVPAYDELIVVANSGALDDPRLPAFVNALERSVQFMLNHPSAAWQMFISAYPDLDDELNRRAWIDTLPRFALRPGAVDRIRYEEFAKFLMSQNLVDQIPEIENYARDIR